MAGKKILCGILLFAISSVFLYLRFGANLRSFKLKSLVNYTTENLELPVPIFKNLKLRIFGETNLQLPNLKQKNLELPVFNETNLELPIFKEKPLVIWAIDTHATPTYDLLVFLKPMGVNFIYRNYDNDFMRCQPKNNCDKDSPLKVLKRENLVNLDHKDIPRFYEAYKDDPVMKSVDAFVCYHLVSLCELYKPFNKSVIIIATLRYEYGRFGKERWTFWNRNLVEYASQPSNVVAANNLYDAEYIKYFTGIEAQHLPNWGNYTKQVYNPTRSGFLIATTHNNAFMTLFLKNFTNVCRKPECSVKLMYLRNAYPYYKYSDIAAHQGIVYVPYQVSVMSLFEHYRMGVPIFAPARELLARWEIEHNVMFLKRWSGSNGRPSNRSEIDPHPSQRSVPDPNSFTEESIRYWGRFCDYYFYPHITYYDSIEDLVRILQQIKTEQLQNISTQMKLFSMQQKIGLTKTWRNILLNVAKHSANHPH